MLTVSLFFSLKPSMHATRFYPAMCSLFVAITQHASLFLSELQLLVCFVEYYKVHRMEL